MTKHFLTTCLILLLMSASSRAAIMFGYGVDPDTGELLDKVVLDLQDGPQEIPLYIEVSEDWNPSVNFIGAIKFDFDSSDGFMFAANPFEFEWLPAEFTQDCLGLPCWETTISLPEPEAVWGGPFGLIISSPGRPVQWATLAINPRDYYPCGDPSGLEVYDLVGNPLEIKSKGTLSFGCPEPAAIALLAIGGLMALRRRRLAK